MTQKAPTEKNVFASYEEFLVLAQGYMAREDKPAELRMRVNNALWQAHEALRELRIQVEGGKR